MLEHLWETIQWTAVGLIIGFIFAKVIYDIHIRLDEIEKKVEKEEP